MIRTSGTAPVDRSAPLVAGVLHSTAPQLYWWAKPKKNSEIRNDAPSSRQPLVKGERLVRSELGAAMIRAVILCPVYRQLSPTSRMPHRNTLLIPTPPNCCASKRLACAVARRVTLSQNGYGGKRPCRSAWPSARHASLTATSQQHPRVFPNGPPIQY